MFKIPKQEYTAEFKELAVKRVKSGQSIGVVAKGLGLVEQTLRNWVKAAKAGKLHSPGAKTITPEEMELSRMRAENARLRLENEIHDAQRPASGARRLRRVALRAVVSWQRVNNTSRRCAAFSIVHLKRILDRRRREAVIWRLLTKAATRERSEP